MASLQAPRERSVELDSLKVLSCFYMLLLVPIALFLLFIQLRNVELAILLLFSTLLLWALGVTLLLGRVNTVSLQAEDAASSD